MCPAALGAGEAGSGGNKQEPPAKTGQKQARQPQPETFARRRAPHRESWCVQEVVSTPEELIEPCGLPAPRVMALVTMLEVWTAFCAAKGRLVMGGR